ncbi:MAG TPA: glycosyltransferase family 2 protein [Candidatus Acidoferrum sp.]|nr:glycosyltransferase family 2 protein [Candidatus Acidoferrum sp.]
MSPSLPQGPGPRDAGKPLVSIIVPTYNRARFLERCVRSVLGQTYRALECIVVDGASQDGSVEILRRLAAEDSRLRFISEPDQGEVYAVNKGLDLAKGEIFGQQASDDYYVPDAVEAAVAFLLQHPEYAGVGGDGRYVDEHGNDLGRGVITYRGEMSRRTIKRILRVRWKANAVCHGSFFGWRERVLRVGKLDPAFSVIPDWEFYLRLLDAGETIGHLEKIQYCFTIHGEMGAQKYCEQVEEQRARLHRRYGMKWHDELFRATFGRAMSYLANPYRSPFPAGLRREVGDALARRAARRAPAI